MKKLTVLLAILLSACNQVAPPASTQVSQESQPTDQTKSPSINIKMDLPIYLGDLASIIHPVTVSAVEERASKSYEGEKISSQISVGDYSFMGKMFNLVFENKETGEHHALFKGNNQYITVVNYPVHTLEDKTTTTADDRGNITTDKKLIKKYGHFIYQVQEKIVNDDNTLSINNQESLYISDELGKNFKKLHQDGEYFIESRWIPQIERYYFTTKSDSDNDGKITLQDKSHNYYIDFKDLANVVVKPYDYMPK